MSKGNKIKFNSLKKAGSKQKACITGKRCEVKRDLDNKLLLVLNSFFLFLVLV